MNTSIKQQLSDMLRPIAPPRVLDQPYTDEQFQRLIGVIRQNGPWDIILKHHFKSVEEVVATSTSNPDIDTSKLSLDSFVTPSFRGWFGNHSVSFYDEIGFFPAVKYFPGVIGGHCVMPNIELLKRLDCSEILEAIQSSNQKKIQREEVKVKNS